MSDAEQTQELHTSAEVRSSHPYRLEIIWDDRTNRVTCFREKEEAVGYYVSAIQNDRAVRVLLANTRTGSHVARYEDWDAWGQMESELTGYPYPEGW